MSSIHDFDLNRLFERALTNDRMVGAYIASSPNPASQREFIKTLRRAVGMPIGLPAFPWMVRIGARLLMRTDPEFALYGRDGLSQRLQQAKVDFQFRHLGAALCDLLKTPNAIGIQPIIGYNGTGINAGADGRCDLRDGAFRTHL